MEGTEVTDLVKNELFDDLWALLFSYEPQSDCWRYSFPPRVLPRERAVIRERLGLVPTG